MNLKMYRLVIKVLEKSSCKEIKKLLEINDYNFNVHGQELILKDLKMLLSIYR